MRSIDCIGDKTFPFAGIYTDKVEKSSSVKGSEKSLGSSGRVANIVMSDCLDVTLSLPLF